MTSPASPARLPREVGLGQKRMLKCSLNARCKIRAALAVTLVAGLMGCDSPVSCPPEMADAKQLVVVDAPSMDGPKATIRTYQRPDVSSPWMPTGKARPAVVGAKGVAWGWGFHDAAKHGEPLKVEGDKRTPAGIFPLGATFGFEPRPAARHMTLAPGKHLCVDDVKSPHYSRIVTAEIAGGGTSGEKMWEIEVYKRGIVVDYKTDRVARAGSCIFVHIWAGPDQGTSGCVAAHERDVVALQAIAEGGEAMIAVLPDGARERFAGCVPRLQN